MERSDEKADGQFELDRTTLAGSTAAEAVLPSLFGRFAPACAASAPKHLNPFLVSMFDDPPSNQTPIVSVPCFEPAGYHLELTADELCRMLLITGSTGAGKTTLLNTILRCLIRYESSNAYNRVGLLITDAKVDGTVECVRVLAREAGRDQDLVTLGPEGTHGLNLFDSLRTLDDVDYVSRRLQAASSDKYGENAYWAETRRSLFDAACTLLVAGGGPIAFDEAMEFMRAWFFSGPPEPKGVARVIEKALRRSKSKYESPGVARKISQALDVAATWRVLEGRTRSIMQSVLMNAVAPLLSSSASRCFDARNRQVFDVSAVAQAGQVCVVSCNALTEPDLAALLFRLAKEDYFRAIQQRRQGFHRLAGFVADEYPLSIANSDARHLATLRSKRGFFMATTQGLSLLEDQVGPRALKSILLNFCNVVAMNSREDEMNAFATAYFGSRVEMQHSRNLIIEDEGDVLSASRSMKGAVIKRIRPVCMPGGLAALEQHQAYVSLVGGRPDCPVWFVPQFIDVPAKSAVETGDGGSKRPPPDRTAPRHVLGLMEKSGRLFRITPAILTAAFKLCEPREPIEELVGQARLFFSTKACMVPHGLEHLPACWLKALPGILWKTRQPDWECLPYMIRTIKAEIGVLVMTFAQEMAVAELEMTRWDELRIRVNAALYPSLWRPLRPRHARELWVLRADLRPQLGSAVPSMGPSPET